ncbi:MAG: GyrI-like domain-containing protein [Chloroflexota bacterium]
MVELLHPVADEPAEVFDRAPGSIKVHELHPREVAIIRVEVPMADLPTTMGEAMCEVEAQMREAGVEVSGPPFARYLELAPDRIVAEIGFPVLRPAPHVGRIFPGQLPGGRVATILHVGPYDGLADTYDKLERWLGEAGATAAGPMWEVYWSDPAAEPDPSTWRTMIHVPLA